MLRFALKNSKIRGIRFNSSVPSKKTENNGLSQSDKLIRPKAGLPSMAVNDAILSKSKKPYVPKLAHKRESYEFPGIPKEDEVFEKPRQTMLRRHIPKLIGLVVLAWGAYSVNYVLGDQEKADQELLVPEVFTHFVVTNKLQVDEDHYIIEFSPKYNDWKTKMAQKKSIWDGSRLWSVEVKQPEIMVTRRYTPLPITFLKTVDLAETGANPSQSTSFQLLGNNPDDGRLCLYIKKYAQGEVARWLSGKNVGDQVEMRGPFVDYELPFHPLDKVTKRPIMEDLPSKIEPFIPPRTSKYLGGEKIPTYDTLNFYAAGTGVAPFLQMMFSPNPYKGFVNLYLSVRSEEEVPFKRFLYFLEKLDRVKIHYFIDSKQHFLSKSDITPPMERFYKGYTNASKEAFERNKLIEAKMKELETEGINKVEKSIEKTKIPIETAIKSAATTDVVTPNKKVYTSALHQAMDTRKEPKPDAGLAVVCGPDGYVEYVAGPKNNFEQGEIGGLLAAKGWSKENVYKM